MYVLAYMYKNHRKYDSFVIENRYELTLLNKLVEGLSTQIYHLPILIKNVSHVCTTKTAHLVKPALKSFQSEFPEPSFQLLLLCIELKSIVICSKGLEFFKIRAVKSFEPRIIVRISW